MFELFCCPKIGSVDPGLPASLLLLPGPNQSISIRQSGAVSQQLPLRNASDELMPACSIKLPQAAPVSMAFELQHE